MRTFRQLLGLCLGALLIGATAMAQPMSGIYTIGDGTPADSFTSFTAAVSALTSRGVGGPVTFNVEELTYSSGSIAIPQITGASATWTITFRDAGPLDTPPLIKAGGTSALNLNGADYITFDGIDIQDTITGKVVQITNNADYNVIKNCTLTGAGQTGTGNYGVHILGVTGSSNDYNVIENVRVDRTVYYPVYLAGVTGTRDLGNEVRTCTLIGGRYGVYLTYQNGAVVRDCDIQPGYDGATTEIAGIYDYTQTAAELSTAYGNQIHNIRGANITNGIYANPGTGGLFKAYNNFVYDYVVTGTQALYGLRVASGTSEFYFNSVYIGDVGTSGNANGFYEAGSSTVATLKNNIFQIEEPATACWAINRNAGTLTSDFNCVYSSGAGVLYNMGRDGTNNYATLALWQGGTGRDLNSVEGNPGFVSATDLHIRAHYSLLNGAGIVIAGIGTDIDSDGRGSPPDIGADEYTFTPIAHDYGVNKWVGWVYNYVSLVPVVIRAEVKNYGTSDETNVPVRLYYNGVQQDTTVLLSLTSGLAQTVNFNWTPSNPVLPADQEIGALEVQAFCPSDPFLQNDSIKANVSVLGAPLSGVYDLGGGANHYATFTAAITSLTLRGVSGAVTFNVYANTYSGPITIGQIVGASTTNTITFRQFPLNLDTPPEITSATTPALNLNGADYITFDNIDIALTVTGKVVQITNNADYNVIKNCTLTGESETGTGNYGVHILGVTGSSNDYNVIENVRVDRSVYYPVYLAGVTGTRDLGNEVRTCTLIGGKQGVTLNYQNGAVVRNCDIQPGYDGAGVEIMGIYSTTQSSGELSTAYANKIHNIRGANITNGIYAAPGTGGLFKAYNNFVYDYVVTLSSALYGLRAASGSPEFHFNSVRIGDVGTTGNANGFYQAGSSTVVLLKNNIFQIDEPATACWAINRYQGTLTSDYNCVYSAGPGALYNMGRDGSTNYATLALWQATTLRDLNSVEGNPGFIGPTDLHIDPLATLVDSAGTPIAGITNDIDGDLRDAAFPDIGADEYTFVPMAHDYVVNCFIGMTGLYVANTPVVISAEVLNNGSNAETDVPLVLFYNGAPQDTVLLSLAASEVDTVNFNWLTPVVEYEVGEIKAKAFCPGDGNPNSDSTTDAVIVYNSSPMHGVYDVGGGLMHIATVKGAGHAVTLRGVDSAVTFNVYPLTYNGPVTVGVIVGASATNTTTFREAPTHLDTPPEISASDTPAVYLNGADYVTFDGIDITLTVAGKVVKIRGDADYNAIKNCTLTGASESGTSNYGIYATGGGNDYNVIDNVSVNRSVYYPVYLVGVSGTSDQGNEVRYCTLIGGGHSVYLTYQNGAVVHHCDLQPGYDGLSSGSAVVGIKAYTLTAGDLCTAYANKIHNLRSASWCYGINVDVGTGRFFKAYNNFLYDFVVTGTASLAALRIESGTAEFYFNSVSIGNVANTGGANGFYQAGSSSATVKNNIFQVNEPTDPCCAINHSSGTLTACDYNAVYGTGASYNMGSDLGTTYANLASWQGGLSRDLNSVEGNPGFVSSTDLHIQPHYSLLNGMGIDIAGISSDIDGGGRGSPPDIGADEYVHTPMAHDYGVNNWVGWVYTYAAAVPVVIRAEVKNYGTNAETDVPLRLYYNGVLQDDALLSLTSGAKDTVQLGWTPPVPAGDQQIGTLVVKALCPSDTFAQNDSIKAKVSVVRPPLSGVYDLGGGANHYATFTAAVSSLTLRGVSGPVTFNVYPLTYSASVVIGQIAGASATNTITFRDAGALDTPPEISSATSPAVNLNGADYITFDNIDISVTVVGRAVQITGNADHNTIKNCTLAGTNETSSSNMGVYITGGGNDYNVIENVTVTRRAYYPVYLAGASGASDQGNEVRNCTLIGGSWSVVLTYQNGAVVHHCDIQPGRDNAPSEVIGIYVISQAAGEMCTAYANKIHNIRGAAGCYGIYPNTGTGGLFKAYNNFVYDFVVTGTSALSGLLVYGGTAEFYFNSVYIGDVGTSGNVYGFKQAATSTVVLENNIFQIEEPTNPCWAIYRSVGTLASDYNCVYGTGIGYNMGYDGLTNYATLAAWQAGTPYDDNSVEGNPGFFSATNLHIDSAYGRVDSAGTPIDGITNDIDSQLRDAAFPDIGADEYTRTLHDFRVIGFVGLLAEYVSQTPYTIQADVQNNGNANETDIPVRLYYDGVLQSTTLVTLAVGIRDTIDLAWTTPDTSYQVDTLEAQAFCPNDSVPANDSALANVTVIRTLAAVGSLTAVPDMVAGNMVLRWALAARANSYKVYRGTTYNFVIDGTTYIGQTATTTYTDVGVLATTGSKYYVVIASTDIIARGR